MDNLGIGTKIERLEYWNEVYRNAADIETRVRAYKNIADVCFCIEMKVGDHYRKEMKGNASKG